MKVEPMRYVSLSLLLLSLSGCSLAPVGNRWCSELAAYSLSQREALPEQGAPVRACEDPRKPWSQLWPEVRHLG